MTHEKENKKPIVYIDMDDTICDYSGAHKRALETNPKILLPQAQCGFYSNLHPLPNAIASLKELSDSGKFDLYILTAPEFIHPLSGYERVRWVEKHLGRAYVDRMVITTHRGLLIGDYLIDRLVNRREKDKFSGELIQFGGEAFRTWGHVMQYLLPDT